MIFLLEYDRRRGELLSIWAFSDAHRRAAEDLRLQRELELHRARVEQEIVLLQADSEAELRKTHQRYFENFAQMIAAEMKVD